MAVIYDEEDGKFILTTHRPEPLGEVGYGETLIHVLRYEGPEQVTSVDFGVSICAVLTVLGGMGRHAFTCDLEAKDGKIEVWSLPDDTAGRHHRAHYDSVKQGLTEIE